VQVVLGFSVHTGWAAGIAVAVPDVAPASDAPRAAVDPEDVTVLARTRIEMIGGAGPASPRFVFHAARLLPLPEAALLIRQAEETSRARATRALQVLCEQLRAAGHPHPPVAGGMVGGTGPQTGDLAAILASHSSIHAAEGQLYRRAVADACRGLQIPVVEVRARELPSRAARQLGVEPAGLAAPLGAIGRAAGRPWAKDQKDGLLAALAALDATSR
jgi:hypothetical protein